MRLRALFVAGSRMCRVEAGGAGAASVRWRMATADDSKTADPGACSPCRGSGEVISNLGGEPSRVRCPWCEGGGTQIPGHDAQARRRARASG